MALSLQRRHLQTKHKYDGNQNHVQLFKDQTHISRQSDGRNNIHDSETPQDDCFLVIVIMLSSLPRALCLLVCCTSSCISMAWGGSKKLEQPMFSDHIISYLASKDLN